MTIALVTACLGCIGLVAGVLVAAGRACFMGLLVALADGPKVVPAHPVAVSGGTITAWEADHARDFPRRLLPHVPIYQRVGG